MWNGNQFRSFNSTKGFWLLNRAASSRSVARDEGCELCKLVTAQSFPGRAVPLRYGVATGSGSSSSVEEVLRFYAIMFMFPSYLPGSSISLFQTGRTNGCCLPDARMKPLFTGRPFFVTQYRIVYGLSWTIYRIVFGEATKIKYLCHSDSMGEA